MGEGCAVVQIRWCYDFTIVKLNAITSGGDCVVIIWSVQ
jgi:hypothetical protein